MKSDRVVGITPTVKSSPRIFFLSPRTFWNIIRFLLTATLLFAFWLLFATRLDFFPMLAGMGGALLIAALTYDIFIEEHEAALNSFLPRPLQLIIFCCVLIFLLYLSSFKMLAAIIRKEASPKIVHFRTRLHSDVARTILANAITLTPGTVTLDLNDDHLIVHWFFCDTYHAKLAGEKIKGRMEKFLRRVWL